MRETTRLLLLKYLGDESKWPFLWDGTMGGKYAVGGVYIRLYASIRDEYDVLVITPFGFQSRKQNEIVSDEKLYEQPTSEFFDAMSLILSRDRIVRRVVKQAWKTDGNNGIEVGFTISPDEFEKFIDESAKAAKASNEHVDGIQHQIRRTHIPNNALAISVKFDNEMMQVFLQDGRIISVPVEWFPILSKASTEQRQHYEIAGGGLGLFWPELSEDVLIASLLAGSNSDTDIWLQTLQGALKDEDE